MHTGDEAIMDAEGYLQSEISSTTYFASMLTRVLP
jgi:hypothetical protein